jgi:hypothetical protein
LIDNPGQTLDIGFTLVATGIDDTNAAGASHFIEGLTPASASPQCAMKYQCRFLLQYQSIRSQ